MTVCAAQEGRVFDYSKSLNGYQIQEWESVVSQWVCFSNNVKSPSGYDILGKEEI